MSYILADARNYESSTHTKPKPDPTGMTFYSTANEIKIRTTTADSRLYSEDETRNRFSNPIRQGTLPKGRAMEGRYGGWRLISVSESGHGKGSVEVLPNLGNYPIRDGPGVNPRD